MIHPIRFTSLLVLLLVVNTAEAVPLVLRAPNGVRVYAEDYTIRGTNAPIALLFHQAGSNRGEYAPIALRLNQLGYRCIAVDQRSGGANWGRPNETVLQLGRSTDYLSALPDLQAALDYAITQKPPRIVVVGSSYSAALVFLLAAQNPQSVKALAAFSPDEYLGNRTLVKDAAARLHIPVYITDSGEAGEMAAAKRLVDAIPDRRKMLYTPKYGVHAASTLRSDKNPKGYAANWQAFARWVRSLK